MALFGRQAAFERMVRTHSGDLFRFAYWLCRDGSVAEDLVQETFARAWRSWGQLQDDKAVKPWLFTIVRNEHARLYERKRFDIEERELDELAAGGGYGSLGEYEMHQAIARLPLSYREPLVLQVLHGYSGKEIGAMLGINEAAVMTRLTRARQTLRRLMEPMVEPRKAAAR